MLSKRWSQVKHSVLASGLLVACGLVFAACPKQGGGATDSGEQQNEAATTKPMGPTEAFIKGLCTGMASKFTVTDEGAAVVYEELRFTKDGSFEAATTIRLGDDPFECTERGSWSLDGDAAESKSSAAILFQMTETNCAGREAPFTFRTRATLNDDEVQLSHI